MHLNIQFRRKRVIQQIFITRFYWLFGYFSINSWRLETFTECYYSHSHFLIIISQFFLDNISIINPGTCLTEQLVIL